MAIGSPIDNAFIADPEAAGGICQPLQICTGHQQIGRITATAVCLGRLRAFPVNVILQRRLIIQAFDHHAAAFFRHHVRVERALRQRHPGRRHDRRGNGHLPHVGVLRSRLECNDVTDLGTELVKLQ